MIKVKHFAKGSIIIEENDIGEEIYLLQEGRVEVYSGQGVDRIVFGELKSGEIFGEMSVIDEKPRSASIRVLEDCTVKVLHRDQFLDVMKEIKAKADNAKVPCGVHVVEPNESEFNKKLDEGYRFIPYSIDAVVLQKYIRNPKL